MFWRLGKWSQHEDITYRVINFWVGGEIEDDVG